MTPAGGYARDSTSVSGINISIQVRLTYDTPVTEQNGLSLIEMMLEKDSTFTESWAEMVAIDGQQHWLAMN